MCQCTDCLRSNTTDKHHGQSQCVYSACSCCLYARVECLCTTVPIMTTPDTASTTNTTTSPSTHTCTPRQRAALLLIHHIHQRHVRAVLHEAWDVWTHTRHIHMHARHSLTTPSSPYASPNTSPRNASPRMSHVIMATSHHMATATSASHHMATSTATATSHARMSMSDAHSPTRKQGLSVNTVRACACDRVMCMYVHVCDRVMCMCM